MSFCELGMLAHLTTQPEISEFELIRLVYENIGRLDVSVDYFSALAFFIRNPVMAVF